MKRLWAKPEVPLAILLFIAFVGGWEGAVRLFAIPAIVVPAPSAVAQAMWTGLASGEFVTHFWVTFAEVMLGFVFGAGSGFVIGVLVGLFPLLERTVYPYIVAFQTLPKVAIAPIIVIWFGYGMSSKVIITATIAFFPVLANSIVGLRAVPRDQVELMVAFTATRWQIFRMARLPQALPYVFVGLDVAIVLSVIGAIVGEFVGSQAGLGYLILQRNFNLDMAGVFAILIILSLMGIGLHLAVMAIQRRVVFWMDSGHDRVIGA
ncbi:NitT/TauT family transport system permease protein [Humitalea rosea]|uniref:NitT/TauT family transport system permease protein n=1 Tax=Humitalea rosea TaxID=990373 RepID=A0A2W7IGY2_9PROT|nr:ABC transporter permease [Humitalea rosea]PZW44902.1 NitT/TauT family transport system permease protein [Humitalea rosea]